MLVSHNGDKKPLSTSFREIVRTLCIAIPIVVLVFVAGDALVGPGGSLVGFFGSYDLDPVARYANQHGALIIGLCAALYAFLAEPSPGSGDEPVTRKEFNQSVERLEQQHQKTGETVTILEEEAKRLRTELAQSRNTRNLCLRDPMISGDDVKRLQESLVAKGYGDFLGETRVDSVFGQATDIAVRRLQADNNLPVTGCVTSYEWEVLNR